VKSSTWAEQHVDWTTSNTSSNVDSVRRCLSLVWQVGLLHCYIAIRRQNWQGVVSRVAVSAGAPYHYPTGPQTSTTTETRSTIIARSDTSPSLTWASCDLDLWPRDPEVDCFMSLIISQTLVALFIKTGSFVFKMSCWPCSLISDEQIASWATLSVSESSLTDASKYDACCKVM